VCVWGGGGSAALQLALLCRAAGGGGGGGSAWRQKLAGPSPARLPPQRAGAPPAAHTPGCRTPTRPPGSRQPHSNACREGGSFDQLPRCQAESFGGQNTAVMLRARTQGSSSQPSRYQAPTKQAACLLSIVALHRQLPGRLHLAPLISRRQGHHLWRLRGTHVSSVGQGCSNQAAAGLKPALTDTSQHAWRPGGGLAQRRKLDSCQLGPCAGLVHPACPGGPAPLPPRPPAPKWDRGPTM